MKRGYPTEIGKAKSYLMTVKNIRFNITASFYNDYASITAFDQKHGIQLPKNVVALLTPS